MALIKDGKSMDKVLERVLNKYGVGLYIIKDNPFYKHRWNILKCGTGNHISWGNTLDELFYNLMYKIALSRGEDADDWEDTEAGLIHFAVSNKLI